MVQGIPAPDPRELLPPLLACLPTAFASPRPPPALLPLLTPILRQRVHLLSTTTSTSDSWLPLLSWDRVAASKLASTVERIQIEPHPVSGEVEVQDVEEVQYRRLDPETLHCRFHMEEFNLLPIYLWCMGDGQGGGSGWRLAELKPLEYQDDGSEWYSSIQEADNFGGRNRRQAENGASANAPGAKSEPDEDDDSAYWAAYDNTPGRTPLKRSPAPQHNQNSAVHVPTTSELEYFARYMAEVQPAMDPHDPSEQGLAKGESTLNGHTFTTGSREMERGLQETANVESTGHDSVMPPLERPEFTNGSGCPIDRDDALVHPRPASSSSSSSVDHLERQAESHSQAEVGIKQHISTDIKSLYRLAKSAGIDRSEFERIVKTELDVLALMDVE